MTRLVLVLATLLLCACQSAPVRSITSAFQSKGAPALSDGVKLFEEGRYPEASRSLNSALSQGLSSKSDQARAHKYLAFIHCVSNRTTQCRDEFSKALDADPQMDLEPSEAGHPTWGPVFKAVKARR
jgi:Tfp pilus assembly protein PilF